MSEVEFVSTAPAPVCSAEQPTVLPAQVAASQIPPERFPELAATPVYAPPPMVATPMVVPPPTFAQAPVTPLMPAVSPPVPPVPPVLAVNAPSLNAQGILATPSVGVAVNYTYGGVIADDPVEVLPAIYFETPVEAYQLQWGMIPQGVVAAVGEAAPNPSSVTARLAQRPSDVIKNAERKADSIRSSRTSLKSPAQQAQEKKAKVVMIIATIVVNALLLTGAVMFYTGALDEYLEMLGF